MHNNAKEAWEKEAREQMMLLAPVLEDLGFGLDDSQPHMGGERFLMQAVTTASGKKLILLGKEKYSGRRVVVKAAREAAGMQELEHERVRRKVLADIGFAYTAFESPEEIAFMNKNGYTISVQAFVEQDRPFTDRPTEEQFAIALRSFKAQEGAHATTYGHLRRIKKTFGRRTAPEYIEAFGSFRERVAAAFPEFAGLLSEAGSFLSTHARTIEQYGDFLTHTDFVPHNFRVVGNTVYLLDHSSLRFGNKYEGWARFVNFMELYNPELAGALVAYVRDNRTPEESLSLKLMRLYRLGEIIWYYVRTLERSAGDLEDLNRARVVWWARVLEAVLRDRQPAPDVREEYMQLRDRLRSPDEKERQKGLH